MRKPFSHVRRPFTETPLCPQFLKTQTPICKRLKPQEKVMPAQDNMQWVLDREANYPDAVYRPDMGCISFLWGREGDKILSYEDGYGIANILAKAPGSEETILQAVDVLARGRIKRRYGPPGNRRVDITRYGFVVFLAWHRGRKTWYLAGWDGLEAVKEEPVLESVKIDREAHKAAASPKNDLPEPTEAQKESGNYKKGHVSILGLDIAIENPAGSERSGMDRTGKKWTSKINHHYGYFKRTEGNDLDQVDVFLGPNPENTEKVFVVNQIDPASGNFDEHKVMMGFETAKEAKAAYLSNYMKGWDGIGSMAELSVDDFKDWLKNGDTKKPVGDAVLEAAGKILRDTRIFVPVKICQWLKIAKDKVFADCFALMQKHRDQFKTPEEVKRHIERVMENPHLEMEASKSSYSMVVRRGSKDRVAIIEFKLKGGKYRVISTYYLSEGQLERKSRY